MISVLAAPLGIGKPSDDSSWSVSVRRSLTRGLLLASSCCVRECEKEWIREEKMVVILVDLVFFGSFFLLNSINRSNLRPPPVFDCNSPSGLESEPISFFSAPIPVFVPFCLFSMWPGVEIGGWNFDLSDWCQKRRKPIFLQQKLHNKIFKADFSLSIWLSMTQLMARHTHTVHLTGEKV